MNFFETLCAFILSLLRNTQGVVINYQSEPRLKGGKKCPYKGRVVKVTRFFNVKIGGSYENKCNNILGREGKDTDFVPSKPSGKHWLKDLYPYFLEKDGGEQKYLRITLDKGARSTYFYLLDGEVVVDDATHHDIDMWTIKSTDNCGSAANISSENTFALRDLKIEGITSISQGAKEWRNK